MWTPTSPCGLGGHLQSCPGPAKAVGEPVPRRQSGEIPNQAYFAESSLQFQQACVLGHWFSAFPEQGFGGGQSKDGPAGLWRPPLTWGARGLAGCTQCSATPACGVPCYKCMFQRSLSLHQIFHLKSRARPEWESDPMPSGLFKDSFHCLHPERWGVRGGNGAGVNMQNERGMSGRLVWRRANILQDPAMFSNDYKLFYQCICKGLKKTSIFFPL